MKNFARLFVVMFLFQALLLSSCGGGDAPAEEGGEDSTAASSTNGLPEELSDFIELDLGEYALPMAVLIPDAHIGVPEVIEQPWGETEIRVGTQFQLRIAFGGDLEAAKTDIQGDLARKTTIVEEGADYLIYKWEYKGEAFIQPEHHFYLKTQIDGEDYEVQDIQGHEIYSESAIRVMFEAARNIIEKTGV